MTGTRIAIVGLLAGLLSQALLAVDGSQPDQDYQPVVYRLASAGAFVDHGTFSASDSGKFEFTRAGVRGGVFPLHGFGWAVEASSVRVRIPGHGLSGSGITLGADMFVVARAYKTTHPVWTPSLGYFRLGLKLDAAAAKVADSIGQSRRLEDASIRPYVALGQGLSTLGETLDWELGLYGDIRRLRLKDSDNTGPIAGLGDSYRAELPIGAWARVGLAIDEQSRHLVYTEGRVGAEMSIRLGYSFRF